MDFTTKELLKRYAKLALGQPFSPAREDYRLQIVTA
jgi:hypothetical protein